MLANEHAGSTFRYLTRADMVRRGARIDVATSRGRRTGRAFPGTVTTGYLSHAWLRPGALVAQVSLDDVLPDVVRSAELVLEDDWSLVSHGQRRLPGRVSDDDVLGNPFGMAVLDVAVANHVHTAAVAADTGLRLPA